MGTRDDDFSNTSVRPSNASSRFSSYLSVDVQSGQMSNASQYLDSVVSPYSFSDASTYSISFAASEAGGPFAMHYNAGEEQEPKSKSKSSSKLLESEDSIRKPSPGIGSVPYLHLFRYADWVDWVLMVLGSVGAVLHGLVIPLGIYVMSKIMTALGTYGLNPAQGYKEAVKGVLVLIYIGVQIPWLGCMEVGFWTITGDRQTGRIRAKYLRAMLRQEVGYYDTEMTTGEIVHLISVDSMLLHDAIGERVSSFLHNVSTFIGGLVFMLVEVWQLALICVFLLPVTFTIAVTYTKIYTKFAVQAAGAYKTTDSLIEQTVSQIRTVYSYVGETKAGQALSELLETAVRLSRSGGLAKGFGLGITLALNNMQWAIMFWVGALLIAGGQNIPPANIMACALTAVFTGPSLGIALRETETFAKGRVAAYRIFEIMDRQPRIDSLSVAGDILPSLKGEIELSNVHFAYPARPDVPLFKNLSLRIPAGKTVALVGASGSGKSTVISLIERFYDPSSGVVKLDGVDIKTLQLKWLRSQTGLVGQEPVLFAASIKENILHGKESATDQDVISASQAANAHSFISGLPLQYETQVGERGLQLSGGQKQRVAIARAVLKNPSILLLDEATSALDTESEQVVQQALNNLMQGRTTVVVAHRLSTIQHADLIAVFDRGQIAEIGTHSELLSKGSSGIYYTLVNLQASSAQQSYKATGSAAPSPARRSSVQASPLSSSYHASPAGAVLHRRSFHGGSESRRRSFHAGIEVGTWSGIYSPHSEMFSAAMDRPKFLASPALSEMLSPNLGPQTSAFSPLPVRQPVRPQPTSLEKIDDNQATQEPTLKKFPVGTALQFLKGKATMSVVALVASFVAGCFNPLFAVLSVRMLGLFFEPNTTGPHLKSGVAKYCIVFVGLGFINLISTAAQQIYSTTIGATVSKRMEEAAFKALMQNEVAWFDREDNNSAAVTSRLSTDSAIVKIALTERVSCLVQYGTSLLLAVVLAISISWHMAIVALSAFPLALFSGSMRNSFLTGALGGNSKLAQERSAQIAAEAVSNIRTVASLCLEEKLLFLFQNQVKSGNKSRSRKSLLGGLMFGIAHCLGLMASACCLLYGAYLIRKGQATFVTVVSVFQVVGHTAFHLLESLKIFPDLRKAKEAALSTFDIISRKSSIDPDAGKGGADDSGSAIVAGTIELQNVFFSYPSRPDTLILQGMHLLIPGNSTTALVGPSGSGKSSVVALIERFYDPDRGRVLLDGKDIRGLKLRRLRQHIALVQQEPALFSTTIRENILYGRQGATEAEVVEAAKCANAHGFISGLPEGYDTEVGERGTQLSGGQKQRIAIARAILKNPKVLLLDEATSALDAESERVVQEALDRLMQGTRTTLVIAHRLSTIHNAPQIAVVSQGQVVEKGTHAKLLRAKGVYAQLVQLQQLKA